MTNLATIQRIREIKVHPNAENLELATVLGWTIVIKKGEYKQGDLTIYIVIDTIVPETPVFEFLRNKHFRIKPLRLRGESSAGIVFPLTILPSFEFDSAFGGPVCSDGTGARLSITEGLDVTDIIGIKKYEKQMPPELAGQAFGSMPGFLIITDEDNLRSYPDAVPEMYGRPYYITRKDDGCSGTFFVRGGEFGVTSRRIHLKDSESNGFWKMARKYEVEKALRDAFPGQSYALQGEVCGPGIQKNKLGLKELEFHLFNIFDIVGRSYLDYAKLIEFTSKYNIPMVTVIGEGTAFGYTLEELVKLATEQKYPTGGPAEGIVIRPKESFRSMMLKKSWSGKVINELYKEE